MSEKRKGQTSQAGSEVTFIFMVEQCTKCLKKGTTKVDNLVEGIKSDNKKRTENLYKDILKLGKREIIKQMKFTIKYKATSAVQQKHGGFFIENQIRWI